MKKILLIEDNAPIRENMIELLELEGYRVTTANNGRIGLQLALELLPDIILTDVMIPELDGHEVYTELKKDRRTSCIPVVFITSSVEKRDMEEAMNKGVDGYIQKPFEAEKLFDTIKYCLTIKRDASTVY